MSASKLLLSAASGAASDGGLDVSDVFSTFLYTGTGSNQTIQNGIDLTEGGLVWTKSRAAHNHSLHDSATGVTCNLRSNGQNAKYCDATQISAFTSNGFTVGTDGSSNTNSRNYVSWTFRKANKFFDLKTTSHTNGSTTTLDFSSLGVIGMGIVKRTDSTGDWFVQHRADTTKHLLLNSTAAATTAQTDFGIDGTNFKLDANLPTGTYTVYCFAHNSSSGGYGVNSDQDIISCGSYTNNPSDAVTVNLGFEPQFLLIKNISDSSDFIILDTMRGIVHDSGTARSPELVPNAASAESNTNAILPVSVGFKLRAGVDARYNSGATAFSKTYIYMAIRRGPISPPTSASQVFSVSHNNGNSPSGGADTTGFPVDMNINTITNDTRENYIFTRNIINSLRTDSGNAESGGDTTIFQNNTGINFINWWGSGASTVISSASWQVAPEYFAVTNYTGTGSNNKFDHPLKKIPEMMWIKRRDSNANWAVYHSAIGQTKRLTMSEDSAQQTDSTVFQGAFNVPPDDNGFFVGTSADVNASNGTYINYLFATVAGVSKVGSFTHSSSTTNVDCGFSNGSAWVMVKRYDSTGDWYVWDSARGIVAGNDPYFVLNDTDTVTNTDLIDPLSSGFSITSNLTAGSYIFYAIAA